MSPTAIQSTGVVVPVPAKGKAAAPLNVTGALESLEAVDISPTLGREYPTASLVELLRAPNSDELIRDLAVTSECTNAQATHAEAFPIPRRRSSC